MKNLLLTLLIAFSISAQAQNEVDALRYSTHFWGGTARGMGIGSAIGAVGADFTSASTNPAGLGLYRSSEIVLTPALSFTGVHSSYLGNKEEHYRTNFNFTNFGFVFNDLYKEAGAIRQTGWVSTTFAFGMNKLANFNRNMRYSGINTDNSIIDAFAEQFNRDNVSPSEINNDVYPLAWIPWYHYWIDPVPGDSGSYYGTLTGSFEQAKNLETRGAINEYTLSFAANNSNRLYFGGTIGIPKLSYSSTMIFTENAASPIYNESDSVEDFSNFQSLIYSESFSASGIGINLKLGLIYRLNNNIRLGGAIHTPTAYSISEDYSFYFDADPNEIGAGEIMGDFGYGLSTPWRLIGSFAFIAGKSGFVSLDYEYVNYGEAEYNFKTSDVQEEQNENVINQTINNTYAPASNVRIGGEYLIDKYRLRGGAAYYASPFQGGAGVPGADNARASFSLGAGLKEEDFFMDVAFVKFYSTEYDQPYSLSTPVEGATLKIRQSHLVFTAGFRF